jgi:maltose O-acetyltransferase
MKTEYEKMRSQELYYFSDPEIHASLVHAKKVCACLRSMTIYDEDYRQVIEELIPGIPQSTTICPPFHCDHGTGIILGENVFMNYDCIMLDGGYIRIGKHTLIGPHCQFYTPQHPMDYVERREEKETAYPITIGEDSTAKLHQLYAVAKSRAVMLIDAYAKYLVKEEALNTLYNYTFSGKEKEA